MGGVLNLTKLVAIYVTAFLATGIGLSNAAEIRLDPLHVSGKWRLSGIAIEGNIQPGDYVKFRKIVKEGEGKGTIVHLASRGGDLLEAMKIGRLIRRLRYATFGPLDFDGNKVSLIKVDKQNLTCASSCFFLLSAGIKRNGTVVGIHRPYLPEQRYREIGANDAMDANRKVKVLVEKYLEDMNVPIRYAEEMYFTPRDKMHWLSIEEAGKVFDGFTPEIDDWVKAQCPKLGNIEKSVRDQYRQRGFSRLSQSEKTILGKINDKDIGIQKCQDRVRDEMACNEWLDEFDTRKYVDHKYCINPPEKH